MIAVISVSTIWVYCETRSPTVRVTSVVLRLSTTPCVIAVPPRKSKTMTGNTKANSTADTPRGSRRKQAILVKIPRRVSFFMAAPRKLFSESRGGNSAPGSAIGFVAERRRRHQDVAVGRARGRRHVEPEAAHES